MWGTVLPLVKCLAASLLCLLDTNTTPSFMTIRSVSRHCHIGEPPLVENHFPIHLELSFILYILCPLNAPGPENSPFHSGLPGRQTVWYHTALNLDPDSVSHQIYPWVDLGTHFSLFPAMSWSLLYDVTERTNHPHICSVYPFAVLDNCIHYI